MVQVSSGFSQALTSAFLLVLVACSAPTPTPRLTLSASKTQVTTPETITLTATLPAKTTPTRVEFYEGNTKLGEDTTRPFQQPVTYTAQHNGNHTYTARAILNPNSTLTSDPVQVKVNINATITQVTVQAASSTVLVGQSTNLTATVTGTGSFNSAVTWEILEGGGTLSANTGATVTYTAPQSAATVKVKATSVQDPSKSATVTLQVVTASNPLISIEGPLQVVAGQQATFQGKYLNFEVSRDVTWKVLQGPGQITEKGIYSSLPEATGTVQLLVSSKVRPEISRVITVNIKEAATLIRHTVIRTSPQLVVAVNSTYSITEVKVEVPEVNYTGVLTFSSNAYTESGNPRPGYVGTLPLDTLSQGEHVLKLTSTDTRGNVVTQDFVFVVNRPPRISSEHRLESRNVVANPDGTFHFKASCSDEGNPCEVVLTQLIDTPFLDAVIASEPDTLDLLLNLKTLGGHLCFQMLAVDQYGANTTLLPGISALQPNFLCIDFVPDALQVVGKVPGRVADVRGSRTLSFNEVTRRGLSVFEDFAAEQKYITSQIVYESASTQQNVFLYKSGAVYRGPVPGDASVFDIYTTSSNTPLVQNASGHLYVSDHLLIWEERDANQTLQGFYGHLDNFSRNALGKIEAGGFSRDGNDFVFRREGNVFLLRNDQVTQITFDGGVNSGIPRVDGNRILYSKNSSPAEIFLWENGKNMMLSSGATVLNNEWSYLINGNEVAYMERDGSNVLQVWLYEIGGEKKTITDFSENSILRGLGDQGRLALHRKFIEVQDDEGKFINTGLSPSYGVYFIDGVWFFAYDNALLKLK